MAEIAEICGRNTSIFEFVKKEKEIQASFAFVLQKLQPQWDKCLAEVAKALNLIVAVYV